MFRKQQWTMPARMGWQLGSETDDETVWIRVILRAGYHPNSPEFYEAVDFARQASRVRLARDLLLTAQGMQS